jgi:hypothetical protein
VGDARLVKECEGDVGINGRAVRAMAMAVVAVDALLQEFGG